MTLRRLLAAVVVGAAALTATVAGPTDDESVAEAAPGDERVLLISDSVGLGTRGVLDDFFPSLVERQHHWQAGCLRGVAARCPLSTGPGVHTVDDRRPRRGSRRIQLPVLGP